MGALETIMAVIAASSASEASSKAGAAKAAAEERLEGSSVLITFKTVPLEDVGSFWRGEEWVLSNSVKTYAIKSTDISFIGERQDDAGKKFTAIYLEDRCNVNEDRCNVNADYLAVNMSIAEATDYINRTVSEWRNR